MSENNLRYTEPRPIETAPKDGTPILTWIPEHYYGRGWYLAWWDSDYCNNAWCTAGTYLSTTSGIYLSNKATHWMPLPPEPGR